MLTRRDCLTTATACATSTLLPGLTVAQSGDVLTRAIPSTGEALPII
jgi:hypothetical protein